MKVVAGTGKAWVDCSVYGIPHLFDAQYETDVAIYRKCANCPVSIREGKECQKINAA